MPIHVIIAATPSGKTALRLTIKTEKGTLSEIVEMEEMERFVKDVQQIENLCYCCTILQAFLMKELEMSREDSAHAARTMLGIAAEMKNKKKGE